MGATAGAGFEKKTERVTERDKNKEDRHSGKSEEDKGVGHEIEINGTQELEQSP